MFTDIFCSVGWSEGLFDLRRLYVYHASADDTASRERFKVMERKLYRGIMTPTMILAVGSGLWLWLGYGFSGGWIHAKVALVVLLGAYHFWMGKLRHDFGRDANPRTHVFYHRGNEGP